MHFVLTQVLLLCFAQGEDDSHSVRVEVSLLVLRSPLAPQDRPLPSPTATPQPAQASSASELTARTHLQQQAMPAASQTGSSGAGAAGRHLPAAAQRTQRLPTSAWKAMSAMAGECCTAQHLPDLWSTHVLHAFRP